MRLCLRGKAPCLPLVNRMRMHSIAILYVLPESHQFLLGPQCYLAPLKMVLHLALAAPHQQTLRALFFTFFEQIVRHSWLLAG